MEIQVQFNSVQNAELEESLNTAFSGYPEISWHTTENKISSSRGQLDPTVLIATITAVSSGLGILLTGLLQIVQEKRAGKIVMYSKGGDRLEVPAGTSSEELDVLIEKLNKMGVERIVLP